MIIDMKKLNDVKNYKNNLIFIGIVSISSVPAIRHFVEIFNYIPKIYLLLPDDPNIKNKNIIYINIVYPYRDSKNLFLRSIGYIIYQFNLIRKIFKLYKYSKIIFYHIGGTILLFPILFSKILGIKNIIFDVASTLKTYNSFINKNNGIHKFILYIEYYYFIIIEYITLNLSDVIICFSKSMIKFANRNRYINRIYIANLNYVDEYLFNKKTPFYDRKIDMIYIGRLEKIYNKFYDTMLYFINNDSLKIMLIGDDTYLTIKEKNYFKHQLLNKIIYYPYIPHELLSTYLNNSKFLILPTETEGLPKILLEAMACGTIPIITNVGSAEDIIIHKINGFIFNLNSSKDMYYQILKFINDPNLNNISEFAKNYTKQNQNYNIIFNRYKLLINYILKMK